MKNLAYLPLLLCLNLGAAAVEHGVIYGNDDRVDLVNASSMQQKLAKSTAVMIPKKAIKKRLFSSHATIANPSTFTEVVMDLEDIPLCKGERFREDISTGLCSGFLVAEDILVTAGHCVMTESQCKNNEWVFDFVTDDKGKFNIKKKDIYSCEKLVGWKNDFITGLDYAVIKLKKKVEGREPLEYRKSGKIADDAELMVIGNPYGLTTKVATGATVIDNSDEYFFSSDLDTLQGNSGSAIFDSKTGLVEGILVRGEEDFDYDYENECFKSKVCANAKECRGEDVIRITKVEELENRSGKGSLLK